MPGPLRRSLSQEREERVVQLVTSRDRALLRSSHPMMVLEAGHQAREMIMKLRIKQRPPSPGLLEQSVVGLHLEECVLVEFARHSLLRREPPAQNHIPAPSILVRE